MPASPACSRPVRAKEYSPTHARRRRGRAGFRTVTGHRYDQILLTNRVGDAQGGGFWSAELKAAGFDGIVIHGKAESPLDFWLHDRDADTVPSRLLIPLEGGATDEIGIKKQEVEAANDIYCRMAGWHENGYLPYAGTSGGTSPGLGGARAWPDV
jgi:hypothetical protein